jgi:hydroxymethylpyrimidine pyrophosphatase-like HAD family hydrolase
MIIHVLAVDYDGTIADNGRVAPATVAALARVRESERKLLLVTGRRLPDLRAVCGDLDMMFDAVVAENGALLYFPARREVRTLGAVPEPALVEALQRRGVRFDLGSSIVATDGVFAQPTLAAIREAGVERTLVFNKGALMLLPGGITKGTGLAAALTALELSPHNLVGIGDAENDHAFLALCEAAIAVADAVPALRKRADFVTRGLASAGVIEFIEEHVLADATALITGLRRHHLELGQAADGESVSIPAHGTTLLVVGPPETGKSTLTGVLVERLAAANRSFCLLDPEGDHQGLAELEGVVVFGGRPGPTLPNAEELRRLLRQPGGRLVLNLSALTLPARVTYATHALGAAAAVRRTSGLPHWLIVDEAHHIVPAEDSSAVEVLRLAGESLTLTAPATAQLAPEVRRLASVVVSTDRGAFQETLGTLQADRRGPARAPDIGGHALERGEALLIALNGATPRLQRFRVARPGVEHRRHHRK